MEEQLIEILKEKIRNIELISETSNKVYKVTTEDETLYAKFYLGNSYHIDNELRLYDLVNNKYLKELYYKSNDNKLAIFKELIGKTIDELSKEEIELNKEKIVNTIISYFTEISNIKVKGYGPLNEELNGKYNSLIEFLKERQNSTSIQLKDHESLSRIASLIFEKYEDIINEDNSLVPIDTNMKNIMLLNNGEIKFIDPGEMISGPILMAYGDITAHTYKTPIYYELINKLNLNEKDEKLLRIYAIFSSLNILAFLSKLGVTNLEEVIPYGNTYTFNELINEHVKKLEIKL